MAERAKALLAVGAIASVMLLAAPGAAAVAVHGEPAATKSFAVPEQWKSLTGGDATVDPEVIDSLKFEAGNEASREIGMKISDLVAAEPDFAYAYVDGTWRVGFSNGVPESVRLGLSGTNVAFDENLGYNAADLEKLLEVTLGTVHDKLPDSATVGGGIDYRTKVISIDVGIVGGNEDTSIIESTLSRANTLGYSPEVTVTATPAGGVDFQSYGQAGGTKLTASNGAFCTSGFVTKLRRCVQI